MNDYFVTGATGVVGSAIAGELLSHPDNRLTLLMRAQSDADLDSRFDRLIRFWQRHPATTRARVTALRGDAALPRFGLPADVFKGASRRCTHIIHCAALVRMNLPLSVARRSAVGAAENIVQLGEACQREGTLEKVEVLSTVGVGGRWPGRLPERFITEAREFHNTYEQSKAAAEDEICKAIARGLPATVHRPSMVVGDSRSGRAIHFQIFYHLLEFLAGIRTFGIFPSFGAARLDIVPVDFVARAVVWSSEQRSTAGRVLHLCSGPADSIPLAVLQAQVRRQWKRSGVRVPPVIHIPRRLFSAALPGIAAVSPAPLRKAIGTLPVFLDYLADEQAFDNTQTRSLLDACAISLPAADAYLPSVIAAYLVAKQETDGGEAA